MSNQPETPFDLDDILYRATAALHAAQRMCACTDTDTAGHNHLDVAAQIMGLSNRHGGAGMAYALQGWCDAAIAATPGADRGTRAQVAFITNEGDRIMNKTREVSPAHQWAGDVLAARLADDRTEFAQLVETIPADAVGEYVFRLLEMVATIVNSQQGPPPAAGRIRPGLYTARN